MKRLQLLAFCLLAAGCIAPKLRGPAQDHAIQAHRLWTDCAEHREVLDVPTREAPHTCTTEGLEHNAKQAECLMRITENRLVTETCD